MAKKVRKLFGNNPEKVVIGSKAVEFDADGFAEVSDGVAEVVARIPGYEVLQEEAKTDEPPKVEEPDTSEDVTEEEQVAPSEDVTEEEAEKVVAPKKPAPRKPAPKKA